MKKLLFLFTQGQEITFPESDLDEFMMGVHDRPEMYEYELRYEGEEVSVKMKSVKQKNTNP
jgi:hypothetical protein